MESYQREVIASAEEMGPLEELLSLVRTITQDQVYLDRSNLLRVLHARDLKVDTAFEMWKKWYEWRITYRAELITEEEMMPHIVTGKAFFHGEDLQGRPCLIVRARHHWPEQFSAEDTMRYVIYLVEQGVKLADARGTGKLCVIYDRGGMTSANKDGNLIELMKKLSAMLQDFYAERLSAVYVLNVNWFYWIIFQAVKPLLNKKTRDKVNILRNSNGLKDHFHPSQLMRDYDGEDDYHHPYPLN